MYVLSKRKVIYSYDVVFDESCSSALLYKPRPYSVAMDMRPSVKDTPCATSSREQTCDIITFEKFEEGNLLSETRNNTESGDGYDDNSIMPPILSKEDMDKMDSGDESDGEPMSKEMVEYIRDVSQSHPNINRK